MSRREGIKDLSISPDDRHDTGLIATLDDGTARHFVGAGTEATRALADHCDKHDAKVVCISTPRSIYRDLQGGRGALDGRDQPVTPGKGHVPRTSATTERITLSKIGRQDLIAPRRQPAPPPQPTERRARERRPRNRRPTDG